MVSNTALMAPNVTKRAVAGVCASGRTSIDIHCCVPHPMRSASEHYTDKTRSPESSSYLLHVEFSAYGECLVGGISLSSYMLLARRASITANAENIEDGDFSYTHRYKVRVVHHLQPLTSSLRIGARPFAVWHRHFVSLPIQWLIHEMLQG